MLFFGSTFRHSRHRQQIFVAICALTFLWTVPSRAEDQSKEAQVVEKPAKVDPPKEEKKEAEVNAVNQEQQAQENETWEDAFIQSDIAVSRWFDGAAQGLDVFLAGQKMVTDPNKTRVTVENSTTYSEGDGTKNATSLNVNLRLPNTEHYWQLKFTSYDEREESRGVENNYLRETQRDKQYGATVGFFRKLGDIRIAFQPRVVFVGRPQISQSLQFESVAKTKNMEINPKIEFYTDPTKGAGNFLSLDLNFALSKRYSLTLINEGNYLEKTHEFSVNNGFSVGQIVDSTSILAYSLIGNSLNQPSYHLESYDASVSWTHVLYRNILDFQLVPHITFPKMYDFKGRAGGIFNLRVYF